MTVDQIIQAAIQDAPVYHGFIGALIGAAASVAGAALGNRKQETTSSVDYVKLAKNAAKAGFNPLTALRAGGSAGFATTTTSGGGTPLSMALSALGTQIGGLQTQERNDPIKVATQKPSTALVDYQLRKATGPSAGRLYSPATTTAGKVVTNQPPSKVYGPPMPLHLKLDKPMPLYVTAIDDNGKRHRIANPDLPDFDQLFVPSPAVVMSETKAAADNAGSWWDSFTYRKPSSAGVPAQAGKRGKYHWGR